jgi:hypothetical protein
MKMAVQLKIQYFSYAFSGLLGPLIAFIVCFIYKIEIPIDFLFNTASQIPPENVTRSIEFLTRVAKDFPKNKLLEYFF